MGLYYQNIYKGKKIANTVYEADINKWRKGSKEGWLGDFGVFESLGISVRTFLLLYISYLLKVFWVMLMTTNRELGPGNSMWCCFS